MKPVSILNSYITKNLVIALLMTIFISTFVGLIGVVSKLFRMISGGDGSDIMFYFVAYNMPKLLCYTLPIGILVATVLTFNRMSADNEITALRASGISLLQIISPVILLAIIISGISWWLNFNVAPEYTAKARVMAKSQAYKNPVMLLQPGKPFAMFPGYYILIGGKKDTKIEDIHIYVQDKKGNLTQNITATHGEISVDPVTQTMTLILEETTIAKIDPNNPKNIDRLLAGRWQQSFNYGKAANRKPVVMKCKYMSLKQLLAWVSMTTANGGKLAHYRVEEFMIELHKRAAWSITPFTFILIAIPLGLQMARRETAAGLVGCVVVAALYYIPMVLFSETIKPKYHPEYFMWGLNLGLQGLGIVLLWRKR